MALIARLHKMKFEKAHERERIGKNHWENGEFVEAGESYTAAAFHYFADWPPERRGKNMSHGEYYLLLAATCYRRGSQINRAKSRCQQGILFAEELLDRTKGIGGSASYDRARYGAWYEYIGDFQLIGHFNYKVDAYERAKRIYFEEGDPPVAHREQEHMWLIEFFDQVAGETNDYSEDWRRILQEYTFSEWIEYKQEHLPKILESVFNV